MQTYSVNVREVPMLSNIGDKFYVIHAKAKKTFKTKCPICDDAQKIEYRGIEFPCPFCTGSNYRTKDEIVRSSISIFSFEIDEYIVNSVLIEGQESKTAYEPRNRNEIGNLPRIKNVKAFHRSSSSYRDIDTIDVPQGLNLDPTPERVLSVMRPQALGYTTKQKAREAVAILVENEKNRLAEFNEKYGCNFEYPEDEKE